MSKATKNKVFALRSVKVHVKGKEPTTEYQLKFTSFGVARLVDRIKQPTADLMAEVGGVVETANGLSYAYKDNGSKILCVAHCDCVDHGSKHAAVDGNLIFSSRLDDRMGVAAALDWLPGMGINADILLTDGEETGKSTAKFFETKKKYNWMVQFDRMGGDCVTYQYVCMDKHLRKYFEHVGYGSYTDIRELDDLGCGGVNVGVGYHNQHTMGSYADLRETLDGLTRFYWFWKENANKRIAYTKPKPAKVVPVRGGQMMTVYALDGAPIPRLSNGALDFTRIQWDKARRGWDWIPGQKPVQQHLPLSRVENRSKNDGLMLQAERHYEVPGTDRQLEAEKDTELEESKPVLASGEVVTGEEYAKRLEDGFQSLREEEDYPRSWDYI